MSGWAHGIKSEWQAGLDACQRAHARSRDKLTTVIAVGVRGLVLLWKGDVNDAVTALEGTTRFFREIGYGFGESLFAGWLGEALYAAGELPRAREVGLRGMVAGREAQAQCQAATNERNLGLIDQAEGGLAEAQSHFEAALTTFLDVEARFEAGRTHLDLAALGHACGDLEAVRTHLADAHAAFVALRLPMHVDRTQQLALRLGVSLPPPSVS